MFCDAQHILYHILQLRIQGPGKAGDVRNKVTRCHANNERKLKHKNHQVLPVQWSNRTRMSLVQDLKPLKRLDLICNNFANFIFRDTEIQRLKLGPIMMIMMIMMITLSLLQPGSKEMRKLIRHDMVLDPRNQRSFKDFYSRDPGAFIILPRIITELRMRQSYKSFLSLLLHDSKCKICCGKTFLVVTFSHKSLLPFLARAI